ncbi:UNVERIFIED_CONTAM: DNA-(apurinic or apyrimidinic site) lyase [Sesamum radiatum]|uniref:DNA-(Apurinic or apyrimidinic site) lyase n=1 Tax=Sesamum radiatum TaxID=300843 RepID=A0AAW2WJI5_SESRA
MKRFFKPVERDGSFKKPTLSSSSSPVKDSEKPTENASDAGNEENVDNAKKEPSKFLTWNANSFLLRIKNNWAEFSKFVESLDPDVIAIQDCGQPGFTVSERKRFDSILKEGKLVDAYRYLHKDKDMERGFSWSGHPVGKYRGKRMRIDYFIVSEKLKERIVACEMHGRGIELEGFYGSDHCPVSLELSYASPISSGS